MEAPPYHLPGIRKKTCASKLGHTRPRTRQGRGWQRGRLPYVVVFLTVSILVALFIGGDVLKCGRVGVYFWWWWWRFKLTDADVSFVRDSRRDRCLHNRLTAMHVLASLAQISALAKYVIPPSDISCLLTHRFMMAFALLYDVSRPLSANATMIGMPVCFNSSIRSSSTALRRPRIYPGRCNPALSTT